MCGTTPKDDIRRSREMFQRGIKSFVNAIACSVVTTSAKVISFASNNQRPDKGNIEHKNTNVEYRHDHVLPDTILPSNLVYMSSIPKTCRFWFIHQIPPPCILTRQ
jgi:hypothetical protein